MSPGDAAPGSGPVGGGGEPGPGGPFPSWGALYATVVAWAVTLIVLLYLFTVFLDVAP